jgi:hypothetical protein
MGTEAVLVAGVEFIAEKGGGTGVRMKRRGGRR